MQVTDVRIRKVTAEGKMKAIVSVTFDDELKQLAANQNGWLLVLTQKGDVIGSYHAPEQVPAHFLHSLVEKWQQKEVADEFPNRYLLSLRLINPGIKGGLYLASSAAPIVVISFSCSHFISSCFFLLTSS